VTRLIDWDDNSVTVAVVPQACGNCGWPTDRVRMSLEVLLSDGTDFVGIRTVAETPCCGGKRNAAYPADHLAALLDHLQECPNHERQKTIES
jgi:hypothetical protein